MKNAKKILIVDDELGIRELMTDILADEGYKLVEACNGIEAITLYQQALQKKQPFDLVLLDIWMPEMDGIKVLQYWKKQVQKKELPLMPLVVVMSGHASEELAGQVLDLGALQFIEKPITLQKLIAVVHDIISQHRNYQAVLLEKAGLELSETVKISYAINPNDPTEQPIRVKKIVSQSINKSDSDGEFGYQQNQHNQYNSTLQSFNDIQNRINANNNDNDNESNDSNENINSKNMMDSSLQVLQRNDCIETEAALEMNQKEWNRFQVNYQKALQNEKYNVYHFFYKHYQHHNIIQKEPQIQKVANALNQEVLFEFIGRLEDMMQLPLREARDEFERVYFSYLLSKTNHNITEVAQLAQMERTHLYRKFRNLGLIHQKLIHQAKED